MLFRNFLIPIALASAASLFAQDSQKKTLVVLPGFPAGYTALRVDTLSHCIVSLPTDSTLQATTRGHDEYLKRILGGNEDRYVKVWDAQVTFTYQLQARLLYVLVPQGGLEKQEPVFKEMDGSRAVSETIQSQPGDSDFFAFSSPRRYFFDSEAKARTSALQRARQRLAQLRPLLCPAK